MFLASNTSLWLDSLLLLVPPIPVRKSYYLDKDESIVGHCRKRRRAMSLRKTVRRAYICQLCLCTVFRVKLSLLIDISLIPIPLFHPPGSPPPPGQNKGNFSRPARLTDCLGYPFRSKKCKHIPDLAGLDHPVITFSSATVGFVARLVCKVLRSVGRAGVFDRRVVKTIHYLHHRYNFYLLKLLNSSASPNHPTLTSFSFFFFFD
ncbi:hypothetical protein BDZ94DRAFT_728219 [Collybia nuda]|uniref:Uncharacterized protein n=1 Tax=Collybia nuda TaxID=64659 RepID=A0A9P5Y547_9AGAR|nr:hypothetical protein BDZ94DRAFT_728219 [Collybia nuda]